MIAADTSTWIAFLGGDGGADVELLDQALADRQVMMVPVVLAELLSDPGLSAGVATASITATGFGNTLPVASNDNSAGRQENRRVELVVSGESIGNDVNVITGSLR